MSGKNRGKNQKGNIRKRLTLHDKAWLAMKSAIRKLIAEHKKTGRPLAIWKNGRAVLISPDKL
ncbi:MAG: hypothetical protein KKH28_07980 [Elusimicrobia bacterium]|nr:hypothetical protein [Elusimicrobiota bacterium]